MNNYVGKFIDNDIYLKNKSKELLEEVIPNLVIKLTNTFDNGGKVIVFGNGGCAGIANQMEAAFIGRYKAKKKARPVLSLCSNSIMITTLANDFGFENIYQKQLEGYLNEEDLVIGMTVSGNSLAVLNAIEYANKKNVNTIGYTSSKGEKIISICKQSIVIPGLSPSHIEEMFTLINILLCKLID